MTHSFTKDAVQTALGGDELKRLFGELSQSEITVARMVLKWVLDCLEKDTGKTPTPASAPKTPPSYELALKALREARQSHPGSAAASALHCAEDALMRLFNTEETRS